MSLQSWLANGWLRKQATSQREVRDLLRIVDRDLDDAGTDLSKDWKFGNAYNAALKLCTVVLRASGYRAERSMQHYRTIQALPLVLGDDRKGDADYLDTCRVKRNQAEYDRVGDVSDREAEELIAFVQELKIRVRDWLYAEYQELM